MAVKHLFTLLLLVSVMSNGASKTEVDKDIDEKCTKETNGNKALFEVRIQDMKFETLSHDDKCLMKCIMLAYKWMAEDGSVEYDELKSLSPFMTRNVDKCTHIADTDLCEKAYLFYKCVHDENEKQ